MFVFGKCTKLSFVSFFACEDYQTGPLPNWTLTLTKMNSELQQLQSSMEKMQSRIYEIQKEMEEKAKRQKMDPLEEELGAVVYDKVMSSDIYVSGGGFERFRCSGLEYNIGSARISMAAFRSAKVFDFSVLFETLFTHHHGGSMMERVEDFLKPHWHFIRTHHLFLLPINLNKKREGKKCDLPNVAFCLTFLMFKQGIRFIIVDPLYHGTDETVKIINFTEVLTQLQHPSRGARVMTPKNMGEKKAGSLEYIFYQRGSGTPDKKTRDLMYEASGTKNHLEVRLTVGKYDRGGRPTWTSCYKEFKSSVALILHELSVLDEFAKAKELNNIHRIFFVLDEFSLYAAYTAVAIIAYDVVPVTSLLCYFNGRYTPMKIV